MNNIKIKKVLSLIDVLVIVILVLMSINFFEESLREKSLPALLWGMCVTYSVISILVIRHKLGRKYEFTPTEIRYNKKSTFIVPYDEITDIHSQQRFHQQVVRAQDVVIYTTSKRYILKNIPEDIDVAALIQQQRSLI